MLEAISICEKITGKKLSYSLSDKNRIGDHIWYISDLTKFKSDYPNWICEYGIEETLFQIFNGIKSRL
jgi:CDP-paratose 2-epimerase